MNPLNFTHFDYTGADAAKFLQGQVTVNVELLNADYYQATAICDLKGRIHFGLWLKRLNTEQFSIVIAQDLADEFQAHIKKFGAFSKATLSLAAPIYPYVDAEQGATFHIEQTCDVQIWQQQAILQGQAWIIQATAHLFQPQELRLHQRGGVNYDKGCYLGQEIIARLWFKAQPKHWLHLIQGQGQCPAVASQLHNDVQVVNAIAQGEQWLALVTAKPDALASLENIQVLDLPDDLNGSVARPK